MARTRAVCDSVICDTDLQVSTALTGAKVMRVRQKVSTTVLLLGAVLATVASEAASSSKQESTALFRSRSGNFSAGTIRSVSVHSPTGWRRVGAINQDPLSLAQWTPKELMCSTGAASRLSLYAVDVGRKGPAKLLQKWFPDALKFHVAEPERGFVIVRAETEADKPQSVIAYPLSDEHITPLAGWVGGVNVLFIAESTSLPVEKLEETVREAIRGQVAVKTENARGIDVPYVLFNDKWHKSISDRLEQGVKSGEPNAMVSKAYSMFNDADGFVPPGQQLLYKAAEKGHALAQLDLIRLSRRELLTLDIPETKLNAWSKSLAEAGADDARFWETENRPFDEVDAKIPKLDNLKKLATCGQPEARRVWAKHLVESFKAGDRFNGRNIVIGLIKNPPLEGTLPITTRVPRAVEAPANEQLKAAALLKTACPNEDDPEQDLFASGDDFKIAKRLKNGAGEKAPASVEDEDAKAFPELKEASVLDKMVNSGSMKTLKEAQKLACGWSGSSEDRDRLVIEIAARHNDGFGKWRRFRSCDVIKENVMAGVCRDRQFKQDRTNAEFRYRDILVTAPAELRNSIANLRSKSAAFHEAILQKSYDVAHTVAEKSELDRTRRDMEVEFLNLVAATLNQDLQNQMADVVTGRKLLILPPSEEDTSFTLKRQPASSTFMKKEAERLEARMGETMKSISEADSEDLNKDFKKGLNTAYEAWKAYRDSYAAFASKLGEHGINSAAAQSAANLWFHIEGIYYFEKIRDRELNRVEVPPEADKLAVN